MLSTELNNPAAIPYFLWDEPMTVAEFKQRLQTASLPEQRRLLAKLLREARDTDVWFFTTPQEVWRRWNELSPMLGRRRAFWESLLTSWQKEGLIADNGDAAMPEENIDQAPQIDRLGFYAVLDEIRKRPGLYLGQTSFQRLDPWLQGYSYGKEQAGASASEEETEFRDFDEFVQKKYKWHDGGGWAAKIQYYHRDDTSAFAEFFRLLDEFKAHKQKDKKRSQKQKP